MPLARTASSVNKPAGSPRVTGRKQTEPSLVIPDAKDSSDDVLSRISSMAHVQVSVNDLIAYEYVEARTHAWRWGLGTVAAIPGPRLVQLMLWAGSGPASPPSSSPVSDADRAAAVRQLEQLRAKRETAEQEMEELNQTLTTDHAHYNAGRAAYEADAIQARDEAVEAQKEMKTLKESDWREIRSYVKPPDIVKMVMEATLITLGEKAYDWNYILKVIRQRDFMTRLLDFDCMCISSPSRRIVKKEYLSNPRFTHRDAMEGSRALGVMVRWVRTQLRVSEAASDIGNVDLARARDKKKIEKMEDTLRQRRDEIESYKAEETKLQSKLGDPPIHIEYVPMRQSSAVNEPANESSMSQSSPRTDRSGAGARPKGRAGVPPLSENVHGGANTWTFTEHSAVVLLSSVLVNYDRPNAKVVTLTPEQLEELKQALAARAGPFADMQKADHKIKDLEDDVLGARADLAEALQNLADAKADQAAQNAELAAKDRAIEAAKEDAAVAKDAATQRGAPLPLAEDLAKQLTDKDKELAKVKAALAEAVQHNPSPRRGSVANGIAVEPEPTSQSMGKEQSVPHLSHAADDRELAKVIDRLEEEIRKLRSESASANDVLESVNSAIQSRPEMIKFLSEEDA